MDTIFMKSESSRTPEYHGLGLKLTDKSDLRKSQKGVPLSNLAISYTWRNIKSSYNNISLKYLLQHGTTNLNYQMDHIQYHISKIIS